MIIKFGMDVNIRGEFKLHDEELINLATDKELPVIDEESKTLLINLLSSFMPVGTKIEFSNMQKAFLETSIEDDLEEMILNLKKAGFSDELIKEIRMGNNAETMLDEFYNLQAEYEAIDVE
jgi:hypothetical protein